MRGFRAWVGCVGLMLAACSEHAIEAFPQLDVAIEAQPGLTSWTFSPDLSGGQLEQQAVVRLRNAGQDPLTLHEVAFESDNAFLHAVWPGGAPSFPTTLAAGEIRSLRIRYAPDSNIDVTGSARLRILSDDPEEPDITLQFVIGTLGPRIAVDMTQLTFINPSAAAPPTACTWFRNVGGADLVFESATLATATPYFQVVQAPPAGATIPALGTPGNPKSKPASLQVCVRITPGEKGVDYAAKLLLRTNDPKQSIATVSLGVSWPEPSRYHIACADTSGGLGFDFEGVQTGSSERCCTIENEGPSGFVVQKIELRALTAGEQALADALYAAAPYVEQADGSRQSVSLPRSISTGKQLHVCVRYAAPVDGKTANAETIVRFQQDQQTDALQLPVVAGDCSTPGLVAAPSSVAVWMGAPVGGSTSRQLLLANQSCAPMQVIQACVSQLASAGACGKTAALSAHFSLEPEVGLQSVGPWGTLVLGLQLQPKSDADPDLEQYAHVVHCGGSWDGNQCSEPPSTLVLPVHGHIGDDLPTPTLTLKAASSAPAHVGEPYVVQAAAESGAWPIGAYGAYLWYVAERPAGSMLWLSGEFQTTSAPKLTLKPDLPGSYVVIGAVQAVDPQDQTAFAWSPHATFDFEVAP